MTLSHYSSGLVLFQQINQPIHNFKHTLNLVLIYGVEVEHVSVFRLLPDRSLIAFKFRIRDSSMWTAVIILSGLQRLTVAEGAAVALRIAPDVVAP